MWTATKTGLWVKLNFPLKPWWRYSCWNKNVFKIRGKCKVILLWWDNMNRCVCILKAYFARFQETWLTLSEATGLTSNILEVDGLSVGVEQLDDRVVIVLHSAADGGHLPLDHRHIVSRQVLTFDFTAQTKNTDRKNEMSDGGQAFLVIYSLSNIYFSYNRDCM